ncbi:DUF6148 family protein [Cytobacillus sp. IB215665]|uniref:DUF6148 family protein n=1 Tax=Cytobacillus sp. IB215665 TaxID=3097357 RepID=UPI002A0C0ACC|nr:DUF6148 family protein [Cytobacillus sp. IB215665]MDX8367772.1 DUF6148 family protein [Cytobacillus sp. IB215665]
MNGTMPWDLATAKKHLDAWLEAELAVSTGQSYRMGPSQLTRADLGEIRKQVEYWKREVIRLQSGKRRARRIVPRDL